MDYGYLIDRTDDYKLEALKKADDLILRARQSGEEVVKKADHLLTAIGVTLKAPVKKIDLEKTNWDIAYQENEISRLLRGYFLEMSVLTAQLNRLNPPLSTSEISPFKKALLEARQETLKELGPVTDIIGKLQQIKSHLSLASAFARKPDPIQTK